MKASEIHAALLARGLTYKRIADILNVSPPAVSNCARRLHSSHRVALAIATALELPVDEVFPDVPAYQRPFVPPSVAEANEQRLGDRLREMQLTGS